MARETKVGLLVGLGIILLVGIIVSDHLSVAQNQHPANLTTLPDRARLSVNSKSTPKQTPPKNYTSTPQASPDSNPWPSRQHHEPTPATTAPTPKVYQPVSAPDPIIITPPVPQQDLAQPPQYQAQGKPSRPTNLVSAARTSVPSPQPTRPQPPTWSPSSQTEAARSQHVYTNTPATPMIHIVQPDESLWVIAERYYDNGGYWKRIAKANPKLVSKNGTIQAGSKLTIPDHAGLANRPASIPAAQATAVVPQANSYSINARQQPTTNHQPRTITVEEGDTLSSIASRYLGSGNHWYKLYKANRDKLKDPDDIRPGQTLKLPQL